jgi:hypothetical protein
MEALLLHIPTSELLLAQPLQHAKWVLRSLTPEQQESPCDGLKPREFMNVGLLWIRPLVEEGSSSGLHGTVICKLCVRHGKNNNFTGEGYQ